MELSNAIKAENAFKKVKDEYSVLCKKRSAYGFANDFSESRCRWILGDRFWILLSEIDKTKDLLIEAAIKWAEAEKKALTIKYLDQEDIRAEYRHEPPADLSCYKPTMTEEEEIRLASIRAKEGAKKHAEAKAKLQKMYDERPILSLKVGESIGDLLVAM